jgi:uncharacterized protein (UPF0210 family)
MTFQIDEIAETISMLEVEHFDVRTVTLGISLLDCIDSDPRVLLRKVVGKVGRLARDLAASVDAVARELGVPVANKRIAVTPLALVLAPAPPGTFRELARALDLTLSELAIDFLGGFTALVHKGATRADTALIDAIPEVLSTTRRLCASVNLASTRTGINMDAVRRMGAVICEAARLTAGSAGFGAAKLVVFANAPDDNPFMAGAFHGVGEAEAAISVGISGPGVIHKVVAANPDLPVDELAEVIKRAAFKITRVGELILREVAGRTGIERGIVDLSLAPTPVRGDSVANVVEAMGLERFGGPGSTAALALLNEAVKRGGAMAATHVGGLSGAFVPVAEDAGIADAVRAGSLGLEKLEAMTSVCSVGLDMVLVPGDTPPAIISGLIADEAAIGVINGKTTAVRIIPVPGGKVGEVVDFGGLFGSSPILPVSRFSPERFIARGGRFPAPLRGLTN